MPRRIASFIPILMAGGLILLPSLAQAVRFYDVEMIIFAHKDTHWGETEHWPDGPVVHQAEEMRIQDALDFLGIDQSKAIRDYKINLLAASEKKLGGARAQLARSSKHRPLLHLLWRQPGLDKAHAPILRIHNSKRLLTDRIQSAPAQANADDPTVVSPSTTPSSPTPSESVRVTPATQPELVFDAEELDGTVQITRGRYLHVNTNLIFRRRLPNQYGIQLPTPSDGNTETEASSGDRLYRFELKQTRRMRRDEIHYLDHPLFGMIVTIRRAPIPEVDDKEFFGSGS